MREVDSFSGPERAERAALALDEHDVAGRERRGNDGFAGGANPTDDFATVLAQPMQVALEIADHDMILGGDWGGQPAASQL